MAQLEARMLDYEAAQLACISPRRNAAVCTTASTRRRARTAVKWSSTRSLRLVDGNRGAIGVFCEPFDPVSSQVP